MKLSIVIVSFNTKELLAKCLSSVFASKGSFGYEVFVVDNASHDGSSDMVRADFPRVKLIENKSNAGFSKANNQALKQARGEYILLLNPDVELMPETLGKMLDYMDKNPEVGASSCRVERPDSTLDPSCRRSFPTPWVAFTRYSGLQYLFPKSRLFARYNLTYLPENKTHEVDSVMGAFLLTKSYALKQIGLLDEDFWMYGEDIDLCYRIKQAGFKVMYAPIAKVIHRKGSASRKIHKKALFEFHRAMIIFYRKHYRKRYGKFVSILVELGVWIVYYLRAFANTFKKEKVVSK